MQTTTNRNQKGFTLIELSIVLVIIGLIVGGVLVGRDLIKAAQLRKQISQITDVNLGANTFKLKYNALPGDISYQKGLAIGLNNYGDLTSYYRFENGYIDGR